jgi:hypothetical protein
LVISKLGGGGEIGDPIPIGGSGVGWQPRLQGNMGYIKSLNALHAPQLDGDTNEIQTKGLAFGGGVRFWFGNRFSIAPTFMGLYSRTTDGYTANSAFMQANLALATQLGIVNYDLDTITYRPALNFQYIFPIGRTIVKASSEPIYYYTETLRSSNPNVNVQGYSGAWVNKVDFDWPIGLHLFDRELRSGGYVSRTEMYGGLKEGLQEGHLYEVHGRLVLDFLNHLWKVQWIGIGASYNWGGELRGWTAGADVAFKF